jgi:DNA-binding IscR family transcriptional regulator
LLDVIDAVDAEPEHPTCILRGGPCRIDGRCAVHDAFTEARQAMTEHLATVSLVDVDRGALG